MATAQSTIDYVLDQLDSLEGVRARKMFGEYALYYDEKVVGLITNDRLFIKITEAGRNFAGKNCKTGLAYPGAKASMHIGEEQIEDREWLSEMIRITARSLPIPKPKKKRSVLK